MNQIKRIDELTETRLVIRGDWTLAGYSRLSAEVEKNRLQFSPDHAVDLSEIGDIDTAGASLLQSLLGSRRLLTLIDQTPSLQPAQRALLHAVAQSVEVIPEVAQLRTSALSDFLVKVGELICRAKNHILEMIGFLGIALLALFRLIIHPGRLRLTALVATIEKTGFDAIPIVALLTFLIGAVVAFLGATVLVDFGASVFTIDLIAYSFLREFGVLLTAVLVAGRTASAYAAQIGSMQINEEIDAIRVIGLDPVELLVVPRVLALLVTLPILTFIAMISGLVGGMLVCGFSLDISPTLYLTTIANNISPRHFFIGMVKAPMFAIIIALIGCLEGLRVRGSAESVGEHTTSAVVQSIFMVIVIDAIVAMFCMEMGW